MSEKMMNDDAPVVIMGTGDFASIVYQILKRQKREVAAFCVDDEYLQGTGIDFQGLEVVGTSVLEDIYPPDRYVIVLGLIGKPLFDVREVMFRKWKEKGYSFPNVTDTYTGYAAEIGEGNIIMQNVSIGYDTHIGDCNIIWPGAVFPHNNYLGSFNNVAPTAAFCGYACAGSHCYIGANSVIKNRISVADYTFVGACSYVRHDTQSGQTIVPPRSYLLERE